MLTHSQVDLEKVEGIEEVSSEVQEDSDIQSDGFCFNVVCNDRTYELRADTEDMRKKSVHYATLCTIAYLIPSIRH